MIISTEYVAGLFDGEGMVRVNKQKRSEIHTTYQLTTMIGMTYQPIIEALCTKFGGSVHINDHSKRDLKWRPQHCWIMSSQGASAFLRIIRPFCIVKAQEIDLALTLQASIDEYKFKLGNRFWMHPNRDQIFAERELIYRDLMKLKHPHIATS